MTRADRQVTSNATVDSVAEPARARPIACSRSASILRQSRKRHFLGGSCMSDPATGFDATAWRQRLRVAQGQEPADLVLVGGTIVDVLSGDTFDADIAIADGVIAGIGSYPRAQERLHITG